MNRQRLARRIVRVVVLGWVLATVVGRAAGVAAAQGNEILAVAPSGSIQAAVNQGAHDLQSGAASSVLIEVAAGFYSGNLTLPALPSTEPITIQGAGPSTEVAGSGTGSVVTVPAGSRVAITDLSIAGGRAAQGGGVYNAGALTMQRVIVGLNSVSGTYPDGQGGGIFDAGDLTLQDSKVSGNQTSERGGGVYVAASGTLNAARDAITNNTVTPGAGDVSAVSGGGLEVDSLVDGCCSLSDSTITGNSVQSQPGGLAGIAGGVAVLASTLRLFGDTIASNTASTGPGGLGVGGAFGTSAEADIGGTVLAHNSPGDCASGGVSGGQIVSEGSNLADDASCGAELSGVDPQLGPLADNGGPTPTMAIAASSPAYDASTLCATSDQRGVSRLQRGASRCDIGAYQLSAPSTYVANQVAGSVTAYAAGATGDVAPTVALAGAATGLSAPTGVVVDVTGRVFVANAGNNSITEYAPEVSGNAAAAVTIAGPLTRLAHPQDLALDRAGNLFVTNLDASVTEYSPSAKGNVAPKARIAGANTKLSAPAGIVVDPSGALRVSNGNGAVNTYRAGANGNVAPVSRLTISGGTARPFGLNFDLSGNLVVADAAGAQVDTFAASAAGPAAPLSLLSGVPPALASPVGLDLDVSGDIFVANRASNTISEYAPQSHGSPSPLAMITGTSTGLVTPSFLSEVPPPPALSLRISLHRRQSRSALLRGGIALRLRASGRLAFRSGPTTITAVAHAGRRILALARTAPLRPGQTRLLLIPVRRAAQLLRRPHPRSAVVTLTVRGPAGLQTRRVTIRLTR